MNKVGTQKPIPTDEYDVTFKNSPLFVFIVFKARSQRSFISKIRWLFHLFSFVL